MSLFTLGVLAFAFMVSNMARKTFYMAPSATPAASNQFQQILKQLRELVSDASNTTVPWEKDTLSLLCAHPLEVVEKGFFLQSKKSGVIGTIYQEPIAYFAQKSVGQTTLILVKSHEAEYLYRSGSKQVEIWKDEVMIGVIVGTAVMSGDNSGKLIAQLDGDGNERVLSISGVPTLTLVSAAANEEEINPRAVQMLVKVENIENQALVHALVFWHICSTK
jgi:hypothetical protein